MRALRGLGAGAPQAGQVIGSTGGVATSGLALGGAIAGSGSTLAAVAATAIPIAGAVVAVALLLTHFLGGGCGMACIDASQAEQIYEAAADGLLGVLKLGMIPRTAAVAGMQTLIQQGQQHEAQLGANPGMKTAAQNGSKNLASVINQEIGAAANYPDAVTAPFNLNAARAVYIQPGTHGWYATALTAAAQWLDTWLGALFSPSQPSAMGAQASSLLPAPAAVYQAQLAEMGIAPMPLAAAPAPSPSLTPILLLLGAGAVVYAVAA